MLLDISYYFRIPIADDVYIVSTMLEYMGNVVFLYSVVMLWRTLRDLVRHPASPDPLAQHPAQPGVWPPPPTVGRD